MRGFLQTANTKWTSLCNVGFLTFGVRRPVRGGLCCNEDFEQALAKIQFDDSHEGARPLWIEMLAQGELGRNNSGARSSTSSSPGQVQIRVVRCMQAEAPAHVAHQTQQAGRPPLAARQDQQARQSSKREQADPRPFLDGSISAAACRTHVFQKFQLIQVIFPRSLCNIQRTDRQGLRENAGPSDARSGGNTAGGRAGGDAVATPPASTPATSESTSPSASGSLLLLSQALLNQPRSQGSRTKCTDGPVGAVRRLAIRDYQVKKC